MGKRIITKPKITEKEVEEINSLISENPEWNRSRISFEICTLWNWYGFDGKPKDISCRYMLRDLDSKGKIKLPPPHHKTRQPGSKAHIQLMMHDTTRISSNIKDIIPVQIKIVNERSAEVQEFKSLIHQYHYLGFETTVGENMKYMIYSQQGDLLACLLFGSSAWSCMPRDRFIQWDAVNREKHLIYTTNNTRFLILPWIKVPHLASHILGLVSRRIKFDWMNKYSHPIYLLETFVEKERFKGTCYKASNWIYVGETKGRSRNDRYKSMKVPIKDIYLYPLCNNFREVLTSAY